MRGFSLRGAATPLAILGLFLASVAAHADHDPFARGFDAVPVKAKIGRAHV